MTGSEITAYSAIGVSALPISAFIVHELSGPAGILAGQAVAAVVTVVASHRVHVAVLARRAARTNTTGGTTHA